jgi:hypothetical protein
VGPTSHEATDLDRLGNVRVEPRAQRATTVLVQRERRQGERLHAAALRRIETANPADEPVAAFVRHREIRDQQLGPPRFESGHGLAHRVRGLDVDARLAEHLGKRLERVGIIVDHQDLQPPKAAFRSVRPRLLGRHGFMASVRLGQPRKLDGERRAEIAPLALRMHGPPVRLDEVLHDGEPQSQAGVRARLTPGFL